MNKYRKAMYKFINQLLKANYQPLAIEYEDEYGVGGKDKIVEFYIKELPGWRFAIWWDFELDEEDTEVFKRDNDNIKGTFFTEYIIDKFKPSRATYRADFWIDPEKPEQEESDFDKELDFEVRDILKFIKEHKYLAFYSDLHWGVDYNTRKQQPIKAFFSFYSYHFKEWFKDKVNRWLTHKYLKCVKKHIIPSLKEDFPEAECIYIKDQNNGYYRCSPRYEIVVVSENDKRDWCNLGLSEEAKKWFEKWKNIAQKICFDSYDEVNYHTFSVMEK